MTHESTRSLVTTSVKETLALGDILGRLTPPNTCLALHGGLGAGKTHLTRGIALGAAVKDPTLVCSPTYVLLNIYEGAKPVYHLDAYRISSEEDFEIVGFDELLAGRGIVVVEWAEKIPGLLPADRLDISIEPLERKQERSFEFSPAGASATELAAAVIAAWRDRPRVRK